MWGLWGIPGFVAGQWSQNLTPFLILDAQLVRGGRESARSHAIAKLLVKSIVRSIHFLLKARVL